MIVCPNIALTCFSAVRKKAFKFYDAKALIRFLEKKQAVC